MMIGWRRLVIDEVISSIQCSLSPHATVVSVMTEYLCFNVFSSPHATVVLVMTEYLCFSVFSSPHATVVSVIMEYLCFNVLWLSQEPDV